VTRPIKYGPWISRNPGDADPEQGMVQVRFADESRSLATIRPPKLVSYWDWHVTDVSGSIHEYRRVIEPKVETLRSSQRHIGFDNTGKFYTILVDRIDGEIDWSTMRVEWDE
jgi:hypothetical protein